MELALIAGAVALVACVGGWFAHAEQDVTSRREAENAARNLANAAADWKRTNSELGCPSISQLFHDRTLAAGARTDDPWGRRFRIDCSEQDVTVRSPGSDGKDATDDDIRISEVWAS